MNTIDKPVGIWVSEFEHKDNPEVVFTGNWTLSRTYPRNEFELDEVLWDETLYTNEENAIIEKYVERAGNELIEDYHSERKECSYEPDYQAWDEEY